MGASCAFSAPDVTRMTSLGTIGKHWATVSLSVLAAVDAIGANLQEAMEALGSFSEGDGRGKLNVVTLPEGNYLLVDDCYNAKTQTFKSLYDVKVFVANSVGLDSHSYLDLKDNEDKTVVRGGWQ